jgi:galactosylceramidase
MADSPTARYLGLESGVGFLEKGGSYVTRMSPDGADFSVVIEKMAWKDSPCARPNNNSSPFYETEAEEVTLVLGGSVILRHKRLYVWRSNLTEGAAEGEVFRQLEPIAVDPQRPQVR